MCFLYFKYKTIFSECNRNILSSHFTLKEKAKYSRSKNFKLAFRFRLMHASFETGVVHHMKYETGQGHRWQQCQKASVRMTEPKKLVCDADIVVANLRVQIPTVAGPKDEGEVNNSASAMCQDLSGGKKSPFAISSAPIVYPTVLPHSFRMPQCPRKIQLFNKKCVILPAVGVFKNKN